MNDIDDRLTDLLARSAAAVEIQHDLDSLVADDGSGGAVVDLRDRPRRTRRVLAIAAALLVVMAVVGAVALVADDHEPLGVTDAPLSAEDRFPVFGHLPASLDDAPVEANDGEGSHEDAATSNFLPDTPLVQAALGKVADDGSVDDVITLVAGAEGREDRIGPPLGEVEEIGGGYQMASLAGNSGWVELYGPGTTVLLVGGPHVTALVREIAGTGLTATVGPDGRPVLRLRDLPDGYTVTAPPVAPEDRTAEIAIDSEGVVDGSPLPPYVLVDTGVGEPSLAVAGNSASASGSYRPVDVDGSPGYVAGDGDGTVVAWTAPNGVTLRLITDLDEDEALRVARGIDLVDEATWRATYPQRGEGEQGPGPSSESGDTTTPDTTGPADTTVGSDDGPRSEPTVTPSTAVTPTSHPLVGRPIPNFGGPVLDAGPELGSTSGWKVVHFGASWCVPCVNMLDALAVLQQDLDATGAGQVVTVFVDDEEEAAEAVIDDHGLGGPAVLVDPADQEDWALATFPTTVFVDPGGIVRAVYEEQLDQAQLEDALDAALAGG